MAKKVKYPRKLRQTIEKIAAHRDERQQVAEAQEEDEGNPFRTLWYDFLKPGGTHLMHTKVDEVRMRLTTNHMMNPNFHHPRIIVQPPWIPKREGDASE